MPKKKNNKVVLFCKDSKKTSNYRVLQIVPDEGTEVKDLKGIRNAGTVLPAVGTIYLSPETFKDYNKIVIKILEGKKGKEGRAKIKASKKKKTEKICKICKYLKKKKCPYDYEEDQWDIKDPKEVCDIYKEKVK